MSTRWGRVQRLGLALEVSIDDDGGVHSPAGERLDEAEFTWLPPVTGTVICAALNFKTHRAALGDALRHPPYNEPPRHPVLFIKPANTLNGHWGRVQQPPGVPAIMPGPSLAVVIGRAARRLRAAAAMDVIAGYTLFNDFSLPEESYFRPPVREKCIDSFGPLGPWVVSAEAFGDPAEVELRTLVDGEVRQQGNTRDLVYSIPELLEFITGFMSLQPGDVIATGFPAGRVGVSAGAAVGIEADGLGRLTSLVVSAAEFEAGRTAA